MSFERSKDLPGPSASDPSVRRLVREWLLYLMAPAALLAWVSTKKWTAVLGAGLAMPVLAIVQGSISILTFRLSFGDAPLPIVPSHGVVVVDPETSTARNDEQAGERSFLLPQRSSNSSSLEDFTNSGSFRMSQHSSLSGHKALLGRSDLVLRSAIEERPLRLLVVGDSLGIGVGQSKVATPIMPEMIARSLSKKMGGRAVYWTCHGGTGASSAWLVRELERGVGHSSKELDEEEDGLESLNQQDDGKSASSDTASVSDESSAGSVRSGVVQGDQYNDSNRDPLSKEAWEQRIRHHRKRFHPELLGPYDIAVVLTGPNDLKATVFPFLLTGEDGEFRKQAQERGGGQTAEMGRVLETLRARMGSSFRNARDTLQVATDSVRERIEETVERVAPGSSWGMAIKRRDASPRKSSTPLDTAVSNQPASTSKSSSQSQQEHSAPKGQQHGNKSLPLIVLPGLPSRSNPMTQHLPLRWLLVPLFDILDHQKKLLAQQSDGDVVFVPAPTTREIVQFFHDKGQIYDEMQEEKVLVNLRDVRASKIRQTEKQMQEYYERKGRSAATNNPFKRIRTKLGFPPSVHLQAFAADGAHANDVGYEYWGRHIADAIYKEWQQRHLEL